MNYEGTIYRPPSEGKSLILQVTLGCSHNKCTFCSMYKDKSFKIKTYSTIESDLKEARGKYSEVKRIFLADGDAFILKTEFILSILFKIKELFPECERVAAYATPKAINLKNAEEIEELYSNGLKMLYMGIESGSDTVLKSVNKGSNASEIIEAGMKIMATDMKLSVTLISGLGGKKLWREHAIESAKVISSINPDYLSLLTLIVDNDTEMARKIKNNKFIVLSPAEVLLETYELITNLKVSNCIFRSNHASNYVPLKGTLNDDQKELLAEIKKYIENKNLIDRNQLRSL